MNQNQLKEILEQIAPQAKPFAVIYSGKGPGKNASTYNAENAQIIIHNKNKNVSEENSLIHTALMELSYHILADGKRRKTTLFWHTFHGLLAKAKTMGVWEDPADHPAIYGALDTTRAIHIEMSKKQDELGGALCHLLEVSQEYSIDFSDILMRSLRMRPSDARLYMRVYAERIPPEYGAYAAMELARETNLNKRIDKLQQIQTGHSLPQIKHKAKNPPRSGAHNNRDVLVAKIQTKSRLESRIQKIKAQIQALTDEINKLQRSE